MTRHLDDIDFHIYITCFALNTAHVFPGKDIKQKKGVILGLVALSLHFVNSDIGSEKNDKLVNVLESMYTGKSSN